MLFFPEANLESRNPEESLDSMMANDLFTDDKNILRYT